MYPVWYIDFERNFDIFHITEGDIARYLGHSCWRPNCCPCLDFRGCSFTLYGRWGAYTQFLCCYNFLNEISEHLHCQRYKFKNKVKWIKIMQCPYVKNCLKYSQLFIVPHIIGLSDLTLRAGQKQELGITLWEICKRGF